jgi:hypothetical protein
MDITCAECSLSISARGVCSHHPKTLGGGGGGGDWGGGGGGGGGGGDNGLLLLCWEIYHLENAAKILSIPPRYDEENGPQPPLKGDCLTDHPRRCGTDRQHTSDLLSGRQFQINCGESSPTPN